MAAVHRDSTERERENGLGSGASLPWKFALYSLQVTNSWNSFTGIISSYCCVYGYFLYFLRTFHRKRHQHFLALGKKIFSGFTWQNLNSGPKGAHLLQDDLGLWLILDQWRHPFASDFLIANSPTTYRRGFIQFLHGFFKEGVGRLRTQVLVSIGKDMDKTVCSAWNGLKNLGKCLILQGCQWWTEGLSCCSWCWIMLKPVWLINPKVKHPDSEGKCSRCGKISLSKKAELTQLAWWHMTDSKTFQSTKIQSHL